MKKNLPIYIIIILHLVGIIGSNISATKSLTISLTPLNLLISSVLLISLSSGKKVYYFFGAAFIIGMSMEIIGVKTGCPFGEYTYGTVLGPKLFDVPLTIGINWFMLSYALGVIAHHISKNSIIAIMLGASMMVAMDLLIEPVAITLGYWSWSEVDIPISNYIAWWVISLIILSIFNRLLKEEKNRLTIPLIISQLAYFSAILTFS
jgi:uncharacterized membrane protein